MRQTARYNEKWKFEERRCCADLRSPIVRICPKTRHRPTEKQAWFDRRPYPLSQRVNRFVLDAERPFGTVSTQN